MTYPGGIRETYGSGRCVYFIRSSVGGFIKIGMSTQPPIRFHFFHEWSPVPIELVVAVSGSRRDEKHLHRVFAAHRLHGEWFAPSPELIALVDRCKAETQLPTEYRAPPPAVKPRRGAWADITPEDQKRRFEHGKKVSAGRKRHKHLRQAKRQEALARAAELINGGAA